MSPMARLFSGITLITVPTIVYGGLTVLGVVSSGRFGLGVGRPLSPEQTAFFRAGHAHAGVLGFKALLYTGAALVALATLGTGIGLVRG